MKMLLVLLIRVLFKKEPINPFSNLKIDLYFETKFCQTDSYI